MGLGNACHRALLTENQRNVLNLMAQGASNKAVAWQLSFSNKTVRNDVSNIFSKL
jgi:DNA-binding NarL/FixJ family response regulator